MDDIDRQCGSNNNDDDDDEDDDDKEMNVCRRENVFIQNRLEQTDMFT
jgi:hypothetical protein